MTPKAADAASNWISQKKTQKKTQKKKTQTQKIMENLTMPMGVHRKENVIF